MSGGGSPCLLVCGLISLMTNDLRVLGSITKAAQFSGRDAKCGRDFNMSGRNNSTNKSNKHSQRLDHHVKKGKRGACQQKAATVLPDRTAVA